MFLDDITDGAYRCHASRRLFLPFASGHFLVSTQLGASLFSDEAEAVSRLDPWDGDCRRHCNKVHTPVTNVMRVHVRLEMWMFFPCGGLQIYTSPSWVHFHSLHAEAGVAGVGAKLFMLHVHALALVWKPHEEGDPNTHEGRARLFAMWGNY